MPKAQEIEAAMQPTKPGAGHKKERRFTVYKPTRVEREEEQAEAEVGVNIILLNYDIYLSSGNQNCQNSFQMPTFLAS